MNKNVFLCHNYDINWEISTKILVTFKTWDGIKDNTF